MNEFEITIKSHLDERAVKDATFAKVYRSDEKSICSCCNYIISEVQKSGRSAFTDDEIYGMAVHYFDENLPETKKTAEFLNKKIWQRKKHRI